MEIAAKWPSAINSFCKRLHPRCPFETLWSLRYILISNEENKSYSVEVITKKSGRKFKILVKVFREKRERNLIFALTFPLKGFYVKNNIKYKYEVERQKKQNSNNVSKAEIKMMDKRK